MDAWVAYAQKRTDVPPGPVANLCLFEGGAGRTLRAGLIPKVDYRGVGPTSWYIFVELYGKDAAPELCRCAIPRSASACLS